MDLLAKLKMKLNFIITIIQIKRGQQNKLMTNEKDCDVCKKSGKTHFRVNLLITQNGFSAVKNAGILFQKKINILMEELERND